MTAPGAEFDVVIPTVGRPSLAPLVRHLGRTVSSASRIVVADDRRDTRTPLLGGIDGLDDDPRITVVQSGGHGPAAARNRGWRATSRSWVAFLDDDVELPLGWVRDLADDLQAAPPTVGAVTGRIEVPHSSRRRPSDWERNVACLERAQAVTADMAIRRAALEAVGGFDERFPRAYREDTDLVLRLEDAGWRVVRGQRAVWHRARPAPWWISVRLQRGNADDVLLERTHGPGWRQRVGEPTGSYPQHRLTVAIAAAALGAALAGRPTAARIVAAAWLVRTARFAWSRIAPGPRTPREVAAMLVTSAAIPPAACEHRLAGRLRWRAIDAPAVPSRLGRHGRTAASRR
jgi:GT2 family glycosyltransferase